MGQLEVFPRRILSHVVPVVAVGAGSVAASAAEVGSRSPRGPESSGVSLFGSGMGRIARGSTCGNPCAAVLVASSTVSKPQVTRTLPCTAPATS